MSRSPAAGGEVDVLVNNVAGGDDRAGGLHGFLDVDDGEWHAFFGLNFFTAVRVARAALPGLIARRGVIVNVSSIGAGSRPSARSPTTPPRRR